MYKHVSNHSHTFKLLCRSTFGMISFFPPLRTLTIYNFSFMYSEKVKVTLEQATKAQRWSRGIALFFL
jgi:hypothetical protein